MGLSGGGIPGTCSSVDVIVEVEGPQDYERRCQAWTADGMVNGGRPGRLKTSSKMPDGRQLGSETHNSAASPLGWETGQSGIAQMEWVQGALGSSSSDAGVRNNQRELCV